MGQVLVKYLGNKDVKLDTLFKTGVAWHGKNDVQPVDEDKVPRLIALSGGIFELVKEAPELPEVTAVKHGTDHAYIDTEAVTEIATGKTVTLRDATRTTLVAKCDELGIMVDDSHSKVDILNFLSNHYEVLDRVVGKDDLPPPAPADPNAGAAPEGTQLQDHAIDQTQGPEQPQDGERPPQPAKPAGLGEMFGEQKDG